MASSLLLWLRALPGGEVTVPSALRGAGTARVRFSSWVWGFCTSIRGGTCPAAAGGAGQGWGTLGALGLRSGDSRVFSQSSGTRDSPADASRPRGRLCPGLAPPKAARGRRGGSVQLPHLLHGPARHTRTLPSAIGLEQLCPPEIITSFLLLLLLLLLQSPSPPPRPRGGPSSISPAPQPSSAPSTVTLTEPPAPSSVSLLLLLVLPCGLGLARGGRGEVGSPDPGFGSWCSWKEQLCSQPSSHRPLSPGAAVPLPLCSRGLLAPRDWGLWPPHVQSPVSLTRGLSPPAGIVLGCGAGPVPGSSPGTGPECLLWGGSWPTLPSHRAQGSGCGAALPSPPLPLG